jgi:hypothetical protein
MGVSFYLPFEKSELDELGAIAGKSLAQNSDALAEAAERLDVRQLESFAGGIGDEELAGTLGFDLDELDEFLPASKKASTKPRGWFGASAGLKTVTALIGDVGRRSEE